MTSHASNPVAELISEDICRAYFSCRDCKNRSTIAYVEFHLHKLEVTRIPENPLVLPGDSGLFDDSGASVGCLVVINQQRFLYYTGWNLGVTVPWRNSIGLAVSQGNQLEFRKHSVVPIIDRNEIDPFSISYPYVIRDGSVWKMWYGSNLAWGEKHSDMCHVIKYAESQDGVHWLRDGKVAIGLELHGEWGVSKPSVIKELDSTYKMWYSSRTSHYKIGYAESDNGIDWERKDSQVGIDVSESGWDLEMIEYPCVFDCNGQRYMLYNGNDYGKTGFGLAVLDQE